MNYLKYLLIFFSLIVGSCSKQEPAELEADYPVRGNNEQRGQACSNTDLGNNILSHENITNLFVCMTWSEDYPNLYRAVSNIKPKNWNIFANPIDRDILNNRAKKEELFSLFKGLHDRNGLDELSKVIGVLSKKNFFDASSTFFNCYLNKELEECSERSLIEINQIKTLISLLDLTPSDLENLAYLFGRTSKILSEHRQSFEEPWIKVLKNEEFSALRLLFLDVFMLKLRDEIKTEEISFIKNLFLLKTKDEKYPWLLNFFQKKLSKEELVYLLEFPIKESPNFANDVKALLEARSKSIVCEYNYEGNRFEIDIEDKVEQFNAALAGKAQSVFYNTILNTITEIYIGSEFCPGLKHMSVRVRDYVSQRKVAHSLNFFDLLTKTSNILSRPKYYDLVQFIHLANIDEFENDRFHLFHKLTDDVTVGAIELSNVVGKTAPELYDTLYDISQDVDLEMFHSIQKVLFWILDKDPKELQDIGIVWNFFKDEEKTFWIDFFDEHFLREADVTLLLSFYNKLFEFFKPFYPSIYKEIRSHGEDSLAVALADISNNLKGEAVRAEFQTFFGENHLLKILKVLLDSFETLPANDLILTDLTIPLQEISDTEKNYVELPESKLASNDGVRCVSSLTNNFKTFYDVVDTPPSDCEPFRQANLTVDLFYDLSEFQDEYRKEFGLGRYTRIFNEYGLTSPGILNASIYLTKYAESLYENMYGKTNGLEAIIQDLSSFFENKKHQDTVYKFLESFYFLSGQEHSFSRNFLLNQISRDENFNRLKLTLPHLITLLDKYVEWDKSYLEDQQVRFIEVESLKCPNFNTQGIGGFPCPSPYELSIALKRILTRMTTRYGSSPTALRQLTKALSVTEGIHVPYESSKARKSNMSLREILWSLFDLTDQSYEMNNKEIPYYPVPKADQKFLEDDFMIITDDLEGGGGPRIKKEMTTLERIESVVREVRFDHNTFGAHFVNGVARAENYNDKVSERRKQLNLCADAVKILPTCGKHINGAEKKMIQNAKETFKGLLDLNNENGWRYGRYMQVLQTAILSSSKKSSQKSNLLDLNSKEELKNHNGQILTLISMVSGFSNSARYFRDRIGNSREEFTKFLNSKEFLQVEANLLRGLNLDIAEPILVKFIEDFLLYNESKEGKPLERLLSYLENLDYQSLRSLENSLAKILYISSFVGDMTTASYLGLTRDQIRAYKDLNVTPVVQLLNGVTGNFDKLDDLLTRYPSTRWTQWLVKHVDFIYQFSHAEPKKAFILVNEAMNLLDSLTNVSREKSLVSYYLKQSPEEIERQLDSLSDFWSMIKPGGEGEKFYQFSRELVVRVSDDPNVDLTMFKNFLRISSEPQACSDIGYGEMSCTINTQYDVTFRILSMWVKDQGKRYYQLVEEFFFERKDQLLEFIRLVFSSIKISL